MTIEKSITTEDTTMMTPMPMRIQKFYSHSMQQALALARETLGPDSFVISNKRVGEGIELEVGVNVSSEENVENEEVYFEVVEPQKIEAPVTPRLKTDESDELTFLRDIFKDHIAQLTAKKGVRYTPLQSMIFNKIERLGLDGTIAEELVEAIGHSHSFKDAWMQTLRLLENKIQIAKNDFLLEGGIIRIAGATGTGKTTAIAKLASKYVRQHGTTQLGIVTCDTNRAGAQEQLMLYGRALGVPVYVAKDNMHLSETLEKLSDRHLVLIDTAGTNQRDRKMLAEQAALFDNNFDIKTVVTLPATFQPGVLNEIIEAFAHTRLDGCLLTKLDESNTLAPVLNQVILRQLPIAYVSDGQDIAVNIFKADARRLIKLALA